MEYSFAGHGVIVNGIGKTLASNTTTISGNQVLDFNSAYNANNKNTFWFAYVPDAQT